MVHETPYDPSIRERSEADDDDLGLSESENSVSAEMIRECTPRLQYAASTFASGACARTG
jgi:hypothetical protein